MKPFESVELECKFVAGQTGKAQDTRGLINKWIQVSGSFTATFLIEGSIDGANPETLATITAKGLVEIPQTLRSLQVKTNAYTSGAAKFYLAADDLND